MPLAEIELPDGRTAEIEFPEGMERQKVLSSIMSHFSSSKQKKDPQQDDVDIPQASAILDAPDSPQARQEQAAIDAQSDKRLVQDVRRGFGVGEAIEQLPIVGGVVSGLNDAQRGIQQGLANLTGQTETSQQLAQENARREKRMLPENAPTRFLSNVAATGAMGGRSIAGQAVAGSAGQARETSGADYFKEAGIDAAIGYGAGKALQAAPEILDKASKFFKKKPDQITADDIKAMSSAAYKEADDIGGALKPEVAHKILDDARNVIPERTLINAFGDSPVKKLIDDLEVDLQNTPLTLSRANELDKSINAMLEKAPYFESGRITSEGRELLEVQSVIRETIENAGDDMFVGAGREGFDKIKEARKLWSQSRKLGEIEKIFKYAMDREQPATSLKVAFGNLLRNPKKIRGFTPDEKKAIEAASKTGVMHDVIRMFGSRLIPIITGSTGSNLASVGGAAAGSTMARSLGTKIQADKAQDVVDVIASGGKNTAEPFTNPLTGTPSEVAANVMSKEVPREDSPPQQNLTQQKTPYSDIREQRRLERVNKLRQFYQELEQEKAPQPQQDTRPVRSQGFKGKVATGIKEAADSLGVDPVDLATAISYETAGTFDPKKIGPTTKWGTHRGFIQFGEPQAKQYGVNWKDAVGSQLGKEGAIVKYLRDTGVKSGMGLLDIYSAINAGGVGRYNRSDEKAGGAKGTVRDKVEKQMSAHRKKAEKLLYG